MSTNNLKSTVPVFEDTCSLHIGKRVRSHDHTKRTSHQVPDKTLHVYIPITNMGLGCGMGSGSYCRLTGTGSRDVTTPITEDLIRLVSIETALGGGVRFVNIWNLLF